MVFKELCPGVLQNSVRDAKWPGFIRVKKYDISDSSYEHFAIPKVGENIFRSRRAIKRLLTGIGEGEEDVWISG